MKVLLLLSSLAFFTTIYSQDSEAEFFEEEGNGYYKAGEFLKAADSYNKAIKIGGNKACYPMFEIHLELNQYDSALYYFEKLFSVKNYDNLEHFEHWISDPRWDSI